MYGEIADYRENWEDYLSYIYFGSRDDFFLVSTIRWNGMREGECISAVGKIELNTYRVPYMKIHEFYTCEWE